PRGIVATFDPRVTTDRLSVAGAALAALAAAAEEQPLVVLVDDAHWLDAESQAVLSFVGRRLAQDPIAIVFAARDREPASFRGDGLPELRLDGLNAADSLELLSDRVPNRDVAAQIVARTRGNPLALLELPRALSPDELRGTTPLDDPIRVGPAVEEAFARRAFALGEEARLALVVAGADELGDATVVAQALQQLGLEGALEPAEDAGLVACSDGRIEFHHPLVRSALYHGAAPSERRRAHAALAAALEGIDDDRRSWHLAAAAVGADPAAAGALANAAARARARGAHRSAAAGYARAASLTVPGEERAMLLAAAADAALAAGGPEAAQRFADEGLSQPADGPARAALLGVVGRIALTSGDQRRALDAFLEGASACGGSSELEAELVARAVFAASQVGGQAIRDVGARLGTQLTPRDPWLAMLVAQARGTSASASGTGGSIGLLADAVALLDDGAALPRTSEELFWAGRSYFMYGRHRTAVDLARRALDAAQSEGTSMVLVEAMRLLAASEYELGHWREAYGAAGQALELAREVGSPANACACLGILADIDAGTGNGPACRHHVAEAVALAEGHRLGFYRARAERALGVLALAAGRAEEAATQLEHVWERVRSAELWELNVTPLFDLVDTYVRLDRDGDARTALAWAREAYPVESAVEKAAFDRCEGMLAAEFIPLFERALTAHSLSEFAGEVTVDEARIHLSYGERLLRAGERRAARAQLETALEMFEGFGAAAWASRAAAELRASGARRRSAAASREHLSPRETQIALAVAEGRSNRDVAAALFLTPKTVEYHLTRVYRKLGVRTRGELIALLAREERR
ncbi:MAG: LuxR C-terminal-related transcriptional regulator, partial [Gaiellaceae bacterium]